MTQAKAVRGYGNLPMRFEGNAGQASSNVQFVARAKGGRLLFGSDGFALAVRTGADPRLHHVRFAGARAGIKIRGHDPQGDSHYFSSNPSRQHASVPTYGRIEYPSIYPGVDAVCHGIGGRLEYDFVVSPGANPDLIRLAFDREAALRLNAAGDLVVASGGAEIIHHRPLIYQEGLGSRRTIQGRYKLISQNQAGFDVGPYDRTAPLVIDPALTYSTYIGGGQMDEANGVAVDSSGCAYIVGETYSPDFPGDPQLEGSGSAAFVIKLNASGTEVLFSAFLIGDGQNAGNGIALDATGDVYIAGLTTSSDFPTTGGAFQKHLAGQENAFAAKFNGGDGALLYSSYLGGSKTDIATSIVVDGSGEAYVAGYTDSPDFPVSSTPFQKAFAGGTYDGFISKFNATGSSVVYSTYLGGSGDDVVYGIALDGSGDAYVTGYTASTNFPL